MNLPEDRKRITGHGSTKVRHTAFCRRVKLSLHQLIITHLTDYNGFTKLHGFMFGVHGFCQVKTSCWSCLPWCLCALAHESEEVARNFGLEALQKYKSSAPSPIAMFGRSHRMTQRFCNPHFVGDDASDVPLRPFLDKSLESNIQMWGYGRAGRVTVMSTVNIKVVNLF